MRTSELDIGVWLVKTEGDASAVMAMDATLQALKGHWPVRETIGYLRRTFSRLDVSSRSLFALVEQGSASPARSSSRRSPATASTIWRCRPTSARRRSWSARRISATIRWRPARAGWGGGLRREAALEAVKAKIGAPLDANAAFALGLATSSPDDIDWGDEVRLAIEERVSMSPDALTALEANLRFDGPETMVTRVFGRLSAWQNWIFQRPNAVGEKGALKVYGKGEKAAFDWNWV